VAMIVLKYIGCALSLLKNCAGGGREGEGFFGGTRFFCGLEKEFVGRLI